MTAQLLNHGVSLFFVKFSSSCIHENHAALFITLCNIFSLTLSLVHGSIVSCSGLYYLLLPCNIVYSLNVCCSLKHLLLPVVLSLAPFCVISGPCIASPCTVAAFSVASSAPGRYNSDILCAL